MDLRPVLIHLALNCGNVALQVLDQFKGRGRVVDGGEATGKEIMARDLARRRRSAIN